MKKGSKFLLVMAGLLLIALGVVCMIRPAETLFASAWMIGLFTMLSGLFTLMFTFRTQHFLPNSGTRMLSGLLQMFLGVFFLCNNFALTASLPIVFAVWVIIEGMTLFIESFDFKKFGFGFWWCIMLLGLAAAVLGFFGLRNPVAAGKTLSVLIGLGILANGVCYLVALSGLDKMLTRVKEITE